MLRNGNPDGKGGRRIGAGRPADWLRAKCQKLVERGKILEFLSEVASGKPVDSKIEFDKKNHPHKVNIPADVRDRIRASELLLDRGWGKPEQAIEHSGSVSLDVMFELIERAERDRNLRG